MAIEKKIYNLERSFSPKESEKIIYAYLESTEFSHETIFSDNDLEVSHVAFREPDGKFITAGSGKGENHLLGAYAEAIEHYIFDAFHDEAKKSLKKLPLKDIACQAAFEKDFYLQHFLENSSEDFIGVQKFHTLADKHPCLIPAGYVDLPIYSNASTWDSLSQIEKGIAKRSSNNGGSLGLSFEDSILHGLNEAIERHYLSLFCKDIISSKISAPWYLYDGNLNSSYTRKRNFTESRFGKVITVYAETIFGSYVAFSIFPDNKRPHLRHIASGSSLSLSLATQRSIDELVQIQPFNDNGKASGFLQKLASQDKEIFQNLSGHEKLRLLIHMPEAHILSITQQAKDAFAEDFSFMSMTTSQQIEHLVHNIEKLGYTPTYRLLSSNSSIWVTQVFIPGFDPFYLILQGVLIAPLENYKKNEID